jgi:hypothetical protein
MPDLADAVVQRRSSAGWRGTWASLRDGTLGRIGGIGAEVGEVRLSDQDVPLEVEGFAYPIAVGPDVDVGVLRRAVTKAQAKAGRKPGATGSGNGTKTIRIMLRGVEAAGVGELAGWLAGAAGSG